MNGKDIPDGRKGMWKDLEAREGMKHWVKAVYCCLHVNELLGTVSRQETGAHHKQILCAILLWK